MIVWSYVMTSDSGKAPNYEAPATTLAICKPVIRRHAQPGDLVIGFSGAPFGGDPHGVRWAGIVSEVLDFEDYWSDPRFESKKPVRSAHPDNIYAPRDGVLVQVANNSHGPGDMMRDLGGGNVLIFDRSWRFGDNAPRMPEEFGLRVPMTGRVGQRRREVTADEWRQVEMWLEEAAGIPASLRSAGSNCCGAPANKRVLRGC